jgi:DNA-binding NarL/FixJ family response regulator
VPAARVPGVDHTATGRSAPLPGGLRAPYPSAVRPPLPQTAVLIVDDQAPFRLAAAAVVAATPGFHVVAVAGSGEEAVLLARRLCPGLALLDVHLPGVDGWEATRLLRLLPVPPVVVVLSSGDVEDAEERVASSGALCYLPKASLDPGSLTRAWAAAGVRPDAPAP